MKTSLLYVAACLIFFCSCSKESGPENLSTSTPVASFKQFLIPQGAHYATENIFKPLEITELKFRVKFDSSAIYQTTDPENQYDINKLYGFADNGEQHHLYSARFGWRWSDGALRLFAYTYNNGVRDSKELGVVTIGKEVDCSIKVGAEIYTFLVDGKIETMPRLSSTSTAKGYQLYPYFGGDEVAPHEVKIWIKSEP
ncbi:MAG: hypothetical protein JWR72_1336 [Flavisolibacter sp.]|jgi:hypothetical protein|nr:hypothetical protein [Flavisolibacter sp.]